MKEESTTMKAMHLIFDRKAKLVEVPKPEPKPNEVLIKVVTSALDTAAESVLDKTFDGKYFLHATTDPLILGWHFAGTIQELGKDVAASDANNFKVGDNVWGHLAYDPSQKQGTLSEFITVDAKACAVKPDDVTFRVAAAAATESMTALQAMRDSGGCQPGGGTSVLVVGAGGGVGSMAVHLAKHFLGAHVTAVCSTKDVERVQKMGADIVIDRSKKQPEENKDNATPAPGLVSGGRYDVIFDTPCVYSPHDCFASLKPGGTYVSTLPTWGIFTGFLMSLFTSKRVRMVMCESKKDDLEVVNKCLQEGMEVQIDSSFAIKDLEKAVARQYEPRKRGRVVVDVADNWE